jgi:hypothetical protein
MTENASRKLGLSLVEKKLEKIDQHCELYKASGWQWTRILSPPPLKNNHCQKWAYSDLNGERKENITWHDNESKVLSNSITWVIR